jgi:hypothetical protein
VIVTRTNAVGAASWTENTVELAAGDGTALLVNADPDRHAVTIMNGSASAGTLYVVPVVGQRSGGIPIVPGAGLVIASTAPVYGYASGGAVTVALMSERGTAC